MNVSIIIVNYNTCELLKNCIRSIYEKTADLLFEIIVVDNNSHDDSVKIIKQLFPFVHVIESKENLGFGKGNNLGSQYAAGKYLFFLNSDTILINNAIRILFDFMELKENGHVACCGGNLYHADGTFNYSYSTNFPSLLGIFLYRSRIGSFMGNEHYNKSKKPKAVSIIIGADMMIPRDKFELISGFDPQYFMYVEEGDLQYRFKQIGLNSMSVPAAKIIHLQGASSGNYFKLKSEIASYYIYFGKFLGKNALKFYRVIELFFALLKYIFFSIKRNSVRKKDYASIIKFLMHSGK